MGNRSQSVGSETGDRLTFGALGMSTGMLVMRAVRGPGDVRTVALGALVAVLAGVVLLTWRVRSLDHGEDDRPPVWHDLLGEAISGRGRAFVFLTTYLTFLFVATVAEDPTTPVRRIGWLGPALATVAGVVLLLAIVSIGRRAFAAEGIERQLFLESTCIAFFVVVLTAGTYAAFEALADAPRLPAWVLWVAGVGTWALASGVRSRRVA